MKPHLFDLLDKPTRLHLQIGRLAKCWCLDTHKNDVRQNDALQNDDQHDNDQHNYTQPIDT
jgi:hypothetical protein